MIVTALLEQPCNKSDNINKLLQVVTCVHAKMYMNLIDLYTRKNVQVVTSLQTSCNKFVHKLAAMLLYHDCNSLNCWNNLVISLIISTRF